MSKIDLISNEWTDLVFEGRNQAYGAYKLRKGTTKRNVWSIIIVALAAVLLFLGLQLQKMAQATRLLRILRLSSWLVSRRRRRKLR